MIRKKFTLVQKVVLASNALFVIGLIVLFFYNENIANKNQFPIILISAINLIFVNFAVFKNKLKG
ncbi:MAG: hypothetical protein KGZ81_00230 [Flavobacteriales bacterium]|nr:hypothetical protein [Flavobacteriales bacterium]